MTAAHLSTFILQLGVAPLGCCRCRNLIILNLPINLCLVLVPPQHQILVWRLINALSLAIGLTRISFGTITNLHLILLRIQTVLQAALIILGATSDYVSSICELTVGKVSQVALCLVSIVKWIVLINLYARCCWRHLVIGFVWRGIKHLQLTSWSIDSLLTRTPLLTAQMLIASRAYTSRLLLHHLGLGATISFRVVRIAVRASPRLSSLVYWIASFLVTFLLHLLLFKLR